MHSFTQSDFTTRYSSHIPIQRDSCQIKQNKKGWLEPGTCGSANMESEWINGSPPQRGGGHPSDITLIACTLHIPTEERFHQHSFLFTEVITACSNIVTALSVSFLNTLYSRGILLPLFFCFH